MILYYGEKTIELEKFSYAIAEDIEVVRTSQELFQTLSSKQDPELVVIGSEAAMAEAVAIAEKLRIELPEVKVFLSRKRLDVDTLTKALRAGFAEVVSAEDTGTFVQSVKRVREIMNASRAREKTDRRDQVKGRIIVVFSAKGGCGKTTLSINLATALSEISKGKVCLVDLDLQFGDVGVSMQSNLEKTISSAITMGMNLDSLGTRSVITNFDSKLDLLLAPTNPTDVEYISGDLVEKILENLVLDYDFVVIDTPPAFTDFVLKSMELMELCYLITTLEMPAIKNMIIVLETLDALKMDREIVQLVLNRSDSNTGITIEEAAHLLNRDIQYKLRNEPKVSMATNQGEPIVRFAPKSQVAREIRVMAKDIVKKFYPRDESRETLKGRLFFRKKTS